MVGEKSARVKIISLGNPETGKTCIIKRYCEKRFVSKYMSTIGIDFGVTKLNAHQWDLKVNIFDLSGQPIFYEVRNEFYKDTQAVLLVYDVTDKDSFVSLDYWVEELKQDPRVRDDFRNIAIVLCANKIDKTPRAVTEAEGKRYAESNGFFFFETSALSGDGVHDAFQMLFKCLVESLENRSVLKTASDAIGYTKEQVELVTKLKNARDNYERLGLSRGASREQVNKAYRKFAKTIHPDKCEAPETEEAFKILVAAREALLKAADR